MSTELDDRLDADAADPFLPAGEGSEDDVDIKQEDRNEDDDEEAISGAYKPPIPSDKVRWRVIFTALTLILFAEMGMFMMQAPFVRIFEDITCRQWYAEHDPVKFPAGSIVPEEECKGEEIQSEVAIIRGFQELFDGLVGK